MKCEEFRERLHDVARDETMDSATFDEALAHADSCSPCDDFLAEAESLTSNLRALAQRHAFDEAPPRVEKVLLTAFRQRRTIHSRSENLRRVSLTGVMGIAAAVFLVFFLARNEHRTAPIEKSQPQMTMPAGNSPEKSGSAPNPRDVLSASAGDDESVADSFIPLSETFDPSSVDDDTIVRVTLSPSALASFGFPVVEDRDSANVMADLILAQDGTPEAIRLVDENSSDRSTAILSELQ